MVVPTDQPKIFEQEWHAKFTDFRLYDGIQPSELFELRTKAAQKILTALYREYADGVQALPSWKAEEAIEGGNYQLALF